MFPKSISMAPIENIKIGINKGNVTTLVIASRLLLEFAIEAVIEDIKTKLKRDKAAKIIICQKISKSIDSVRNTIGEVIKKKMTKFK